MAIPRVLLVDDHALVRAGVRMLLEMEGGVEVVGEAANGREAVQLVEELAPDIVIMDISMPELNGLDTTERIKRDHPETKVILLSMHANDDYISNALERGADSYLVKDAAQWELGLAIRAVQRGFRYLSPAVAKRILVRHGAQTLPPRALTSRQREIVQLIAEGNTTKGIARKLGLSVKTVESHRSQIMDRLDIHDLAGLVRFAIRTGLVGREV